MGTSIQKITPFLWFNNQAKAAVDFYLSIFPDSKVVSSQQYSDTPSGAVETYTIELIGQKFILMSSGPQFKINEAISFVIEPYMCLNPPSESMNQPFYEKSFRFRRRAQ